MTLTWGFIQASINYTKSLEKTLNDNLISPLSKCASSKGKANLVYDAICKVLSERQEIVSWETFAEQDWQLLTQIAETNGVGALLYWQLGKLDGWVIGENGGQGAIGRKEHRTVPPDVQQDLKAAYYQTAARNELVYKELCRVLTAFEAADIPVMVLKGAAFLKRAQEGVAQRLYPDPGLRPMNDIDLLVRPEHLGTSLKLLHQLEYALWKMTYHAMLVGGRPQPMTIELHWCLHSPGKEATAPDKLFKNISDTTLNDLQAHFLYLCAHLFYQHFDDKRRLIWGYDLYLLAKNESIDWVALEEKAIQVGWQTALYATLQWVQEIFRGGGFTPLSATEGLQTKGISPTGNVTWVPDAEMIQSWMRQAFSILPLRQKITWLRGMIFPSADYIRWRYHPEPDWLWPLYLWFRWRSLLVGTAGPE